MGSAVTETKDAVVDSIRGTLTDELQHAWIPADAIAVKRRNSISIRVRIIHEVFRDKTDREREMIVLPALRKLPQELEQDITMVLCLAPEEVGKSLSNLEFENPTPSPL